MPDRVARFITIAGRVQGVGFRPFVYRLAHRHGITGWVRNVDGVVEIHAEGLAGALQDFTVALVNEAPPLSSPDVPHKADCEPRHPDAFFILDSAATLPADGESDSANLSHAGLNHLPPDGYVCADCLAELRDAANRRYRYPFINCTQCGPRYTLITALPYDRPNTAMRDFALCADCQQEYDNPLDRRFHAEPIACPACGPHLQFMSGEATVTGDEAALAAAVVALRAGQIVAVKGIGGYHLLCDARNNDAIMTLRARKPRPAKPLAVMFHDINSLRAELETTPEVYSLLSSPERPIVLCPKRPDTRLSVHVAPGLAEVGCLLPYSPLHALLLDDFGGPLIATSGNLSGEPVLTDNHEAQTRLARVADAFLHHDRAIVRPADDSVYRVIGGLPRPLRLGRGHAPLELELPVPLREPVLALGSHMKNTLCLAWGRRAVVLPHLGELDNVRSLDTFAQAVTDVQRLYRVRASRLLIDRHSGYGYRRFARDSGLPLDEIWHHRAHASSLAWEFPVIDEWIVFAWDGVGLGEDTTLWGGEAYTGAPGRWQRNASFRGFRLPGGDKAGREPWRAAAALLWENALPATFAPEPLHRAWNAGVNSPLTSSVGRLFDAAAALTSTCTHASFEGEGPMRLEALAASVAATLDSDPIPLPLARDAEGVWRSDWAPLLPMLADSAAPAAERAVRLHASLAQALLDQARELRADTGIRSVGLSGGVFQNRVLTERAIGLLEADGFVVCLPRRIPVNDAGLSLGQVIEFLYTFSS